MSAADPACSRPFHIVFSAGFRAAWKSIFAYVLFSTYVGIGALAHDFGFTLAWTVTSTVVVWAGPGQMILVSGLGAGAGLVETAIAVSLSGVRLLPMVASMAPLLRGPRTRTWHLLLPAHFTAISLWIETLRLVPTLPREQRISFCNGLGVGYLCSAVVGTCIGFYLSGRLPLLLSSALLFLTPLSFFYSTARNSRLLVDRLALALGLVIGPILVGMQVGLGLMWTGLVGGTVAYAVHRFLRARP